MGLSIWPLIIALSKLARLVKELVMLGLYFYFLPFLEDASNITYLPSRKPDEVKKLGGWALMVRVTDDDNFGYDNPLLGKELEKFYNQCFIETGKFTAPHSGAVIRYEMTGLLHRDNHDGFTFDVPNLGRFMVISHDGDMTIWMKHLKLPESATKLAMPVSLVSGGI